MRNLGQSLLLNLADELAGSKEQRSLWTPNPDREDGTPNPQMLAAESPADIVGYGGSAGCGKSSLLIGLAGTRHKRAVIFRRTFPELRGLIEDSRAIYNAEGFDHSKDSYNESLHRWSLDGGKKIIEFESCQLEKDKEKQRGRARDFYGFDEATEFSRSQIEFITAWNRSTEPNQRCRVILTFNPPTDEAGSWIIDYFLPWIAYLFPHKYVHPNPAAPGELRWYATVEGKEIECKDGKSFDHHGETIHPRSRTFIPGRLKDNPYLANTNYESVLHSLPEPLRSQVLYGDFAAAAPANPWQVIPTEWVRLAQKRWTEMEGPEISLSSVGIDPSRGGQDKTAIAKRYGNWFEVIKHPGATAKDGPIVAELVRQAIPAVEHAEYMYIDVVGVGSSPYDFLKEWYNVIPFNGAERSSHRDRSGKLKMKNKRAEVYWRFREALDPELGDNLALPPDNELLADLCAATYSVSAGGVQIEEKVKIKDRIGRSPDVGEAVMMAYLPGYGTIEIPVEETKTESNRWNRSGAAGSRWKKR